jgi:hypothetical protein
MVALSHKASVLYSTPDVAYQLQAIPNDPLYSQQWGLQSIETPEAWNWSSGGSSITVAVLDTGITLNHPDLAANIWTNPDPGQNGYTNDFHGWNFVSNNNDPSDEIGHGTHVSGIVGAVGNNNLGVAGVNWSVSLMPLKICNGEGCDLSEEIAALEYAVDHGAKVVNASFGGPYGGYKPEEEAITAAGEAGLLYVASAGNESTNNDAYPSYPASYDLENIISVAATTSSETLAFFSNYGSTSVSLGAPGQEIMSTLPTSGTYSSSTGYGELSGTSMAAPQVAGAAALLWSLHPSWTVQQIRTRLLTTRRPMTALFGKVSSCGELDLGAATNPAVPERASVCVALTGTGSGSVSSAPGGIECGSICETGITPGTQITLTATPEGGSTFAGWRGACTGTGTCTVSPATGASVTAVFRRSGTPAGWEEEPLAPPNGREAFPPGSNPPFSFYNVSLSADGATRAKTIFTLPSGPCSYVSSDTGGVFVEQKTPSGWVSEGGLTAPAMGSDSGARWANCSAYGGVTELSGDGSTLLVSPEMDAVYTSESGTTYRCAAFVYRHGAGGWVLEETLFPPGIGAGGSSSWEGCDYFGIGGAISESGTRVAVLSDGRVDVFVRENSSWSLEQHIVLPEGSGCTETIGPKPIALSGNGATLLVGAPDCETGGQAGGGRVYVYTRSGSSWSLAQTIDSPEEQQGNNFGNSIAISADGETAAINVGPSSAGLPQEAGAAWIFEHDASGWHAAARLTAPTPEKDGNFSCPTIIENGSRAVCHAYDSIGFNSRQGSIYIFERPSGGAWSSSASPTRLFATDGASFDELGNSGPERWPTFAASADGSVIDATISAENLTSGAYPNDRIGYEFRAATPGSPTITRLSPSSGAVGSSVTISGTNLRGASAVTFTGATASSYSIDSDTQITATVPVAATTGPIAVTTRGGEATSAEPFTVLPSLTTTASDTIVAGGQIHDTATLSGGSSPTGMIGFRLYSSSDTACSNPIGGALIAEVSHGNGSYESSSITEEAPGTYQWVASYSGDEGNAPLEGACNDPSERVIVTKGAPTLSTNASPGIVLGAGQLTDSVTVNGRVNPVAGAIVTFNLYGPDDATCASVPVFNSIAAYSVAGGPVSSAAFTPTQAGTYRWTAAYSGDADNEPVTGACNAAEETVTVAKASPAITTNAVPTATVGEVIHDTATLSGGASPTGTIDFRLYATSDTACSQPLRATLSTEVTHGNGTYQSPSITESAPGAYQWVATYSGDEGNAPMEAACNDPAERVVVQLQAIDIEEVVIESASQSAATWRESKRSAQNLRDRHVPVGTTFSISLNVPASVFFNFTHRVGGRKLRGHCVALTPGNRRKRSCRRTVSAGSLRFQAHADTNPVRFKGRLSATKKLRPGRYTLIITATDVAGQRSNSKSLSFMIVQ